MSVEPSVESPQPPLPSNLRAFGPDFVEKTLAAIRFGYLHESSGLGHLHPVVAADSSDRISMFPPIVMVRSIMPTGGLTAGKPQSVGMWWSS